MTVAVQYKVTPNLLDGRIFLTKKLLHKHASYGIQNELVLTASHIYIILCILFHYGILCYISITFVHTELILVLYIFIYII